MNYIDCHCHLADNYFYRKIDEMMQFWQDSGITKIGSMSTNCKSIQRNINLSNIYPEMIDIGIGIHPWGAHKISDIELEQIEQYLKENKKAIIGEVGLDHYFIKNKEHQEKQKSLFIFFLEKAQKYKRSLMLHMTGAEKEIYDLLTSIRHKVKICCHWFSGSEQILRKFYDLGCYFSINPAFIRSKNHRKVLNIVDKDRLLTESDGPVKFNGKHNSPNVIPELVNNIAFLLKIKRNEFMELLYHNYISYLNL